MDDRPPVNTELGVEPSHALMLETATDTSVDSAPLSAETTAESVALSTETTTDSLEFSSPSAEDSSNSDNSTKIEEIPIDNADGKIELAAENATVIVNLAADNYGVVELAPDSGATAFQSPSDPKETGAEELLTECIDGVERANCRRSEEGLVDLTSDSDIETVNLDTESSMAMEERFCENIDGVVDLASDEDLAISELETERPEDLEESPNLSNVTLGSIYDDNSTNRNIGQGPEDANNTDGPRSNGTSPSEDSNSMGPRLNGPNDSLGPRNGGGPTDNLGTAENEHQQHSRDDLRTTNTRGEGDVVRGFTSSGPRLPLNRPRTPQVRPWVQLLSPRWISLVLATWEASLRQLNITLGAVGRQISAKWWLWNPVLIPLITGRGSACCPRSLMIGMTSRACVPLAERQILGEQIASGDTLSVTVHEPLSHSAIDILETGYECVDDQSSLWSGMSGTSVTSSWETMQGSSEQSLSTSSCSDSLEDFSDDDLEDVALNPKPIIDAPVEDLEDVDENEVCKVCYSRRIIRKAFGPCGHAQLCGVCISGYKPRHHCPICRRRIDMILNIY